PSDERRTADHPSIVHRTARGRPLHERCATVARGLGGRRHSRDREVRMSEIVAAVPRSPAELAGAVGGLVVLGLAEALGTGAVGNVIQATPLLLAPAVGAVALTAPALVVAHQFLAVRSPVGAVVDGLAAAAVRVGQVAWGFAPVTLWFAV